MAALFVDLSKAFDTVDRSLLIKIVTLGLTTVPYYSFRTTLLVGGSVLHWEAVILVSFH